MRRAAIQKAPSLLGERRAVGTGCCPAMGATLSARPLQGAGPLLLGAFAAAGLAEILGLAALAAMGAIDGGLAAALTLCVLGLLATLLVSTVALQRLRTALRRRLDERTAVATYPGQSEEGACESGPVRSDRGRLDRARARARRRR